MIAERVGIVTFSQQTFRRGGRLECEASQPLRVFRPLPAVSDRLAVLPQYLMPKGALTRLAGRIAGARAGAVTTALIRRFVARYGVDMSEAAEPDVTRYPTFNAFFTRALRADARPLAPSGWLCPVDGAISQCGAIDRDRIVQAKGHDYSARELLGGADRRDRLAGQLRGRTGAGNGGRTVDDRLGQCPNGRRIHPDSLEQRRGDTVGLIEQGHQDMSGTHVRVAGSGRGVHGSTQCLLCLGRGSEAVHFAYLSL